MRTKVSIAQIVLVLWRPKYFVDWGGDKMPTCNFSASAAGSSVISINTHTASFLCDARTSAAQISSPCLKKCTSIFSALCLSNIDPFQQQLVGMSWKKHWTKLCKKCPLHLKYVLALPWEIWSDRLNRQRSTCMCILMNHWIATKRLAVLSPKTSNVQ